ncbi:DUF2309 domain-containing protein [Aestuariibacter halophilus]|uniref:Probable inorganic carbon transporter subunit DabA n=1 Tax=Fluctibacter halophilus TaxID=226011 RepID=A0ABS8GD42_9ALTE|nr:DUF2309 domain-containing protein [Aestuariibacter halophilus]MCC2618303.1 DUF2309 domain-containing protein [Aestuariibacter halophilus]
MNQAAEVVQSTDMPLDEAVHAAIQRIAPQWPLDQWIAVNPLWQWREQPVEEVVARVTYLCGARILPESRWFEQQWQSVLQHRHLQQAASLLDAECDIEALREALDDKRPLPRWRAYSEFLDAEGRSSPTLSWHDEIIQQISQQCADYTQLQGQKPDSLYRYWLDSVSHDLGLPVLMGARGLEQHFATLPDTPQALVQHGLASLGVSPACAGDVCYALLLDVKGWASWAAHQGWQNGALENEEQLFNVLAIRMAWECVLFDYHADVAPESHQRARQRWQQQLLNHSQRLATVRQMQSPLWVWLRAAELAYQQGLLTTLGHTPQQTEDVQMQAAFCIDVRSEPFRRALERDNPDIETLGFAGFFGVALSTRCHGGFTQRHLPGLLEPQFTLTFDDDSRTRQRGRSKWLTGQLKGAGPTMFAGVEAWGALDAWRMLRNTVRPAPAKITRLRPGQVLDHQGQPASAEQKAELCAGVLQHLGITQRLAPWVAIVGHTSEHLNNPQRSGFECGACGGQGGLANATVLVTWLNDPEVRQALLSLEIHIPASTQFVAAVHDTVTDQVHWQDDCSLPEHLRQAFDRAGAENRRQRAPGLSDSADGLLLRGRQWSQLRPEWGLANNAGFIIAPRKATRGINLQGRTFLHEYDGASDTNGERLLQIISAPMVVAHWISMQYLMSRTDNRQFGAGDKMLHNVVGNHLGVFEGNAGDLRIGLSKQSIHDGADWRHEPLRLSVVVQAGAEHIDSVLERAPVVKTLITKGWVHLICWQPHTPQPFRLRTTEGWVALDYSF